MKSKQWIASVICKVYLNFKDEKMYCYLKKQITIHGENNVIFRLVNIFWIEINDEKCHFLSDDYKKLRIRKEPKFASIFGIIKAKQLNNINCCPNKFPAKYFY